MVFRAGVVRDHYRSRLVRLSFPFILREPLIGCNGGAARIIVIVLPLTVKLTEYTIFSYSDVWCKENDKVAVGGDVTRESTEADLACEGDASESAQVEGSFCKAAKAILQAIAVVIDLIWTNTAGK